MNTPYLNTEAIIMSNADIKEAKPKKQIAQTKQFDFLSLTL